LTGISAPSLSQTVNYQYDPNNNRLEEQDIGSGATTYLEYGYDPGGSLIMEMNKGATGITDTFIPDRTGGVTPTAHEDASGNLTWLITDWNGSVQDVVTNAGTFSDKVVFNAFGLKTKADSTPSLASIYAFQGMLQGTASVPSNIFPLYKSGFRYDDPNTENFINQDPLGFGGGSANLYEFGNDNPVANTDPTGLEPQSGLSSNVNWAGSNPGPASFLNPWSVAPPSAPAAANPWEPGLQQQAAADLGQWSSPGAIEQMYGNSGSAVSSSAESFVDEGNAMLAADAERSSQARIQAEIASSPTYMGGETYDAGVSSAQAGFEAFINGAYASETKMVQQPAFQAVDFANDYVYFLSDGLLGKSNLNLSDVSQLQATGQTNWGRATAAAIPIVGSGYNAYSGTSLLTGQQLSGVEQVSAGFGLLSDIANVGAFTAGVSGYNPTMTELAGSISDVVTNPKVNPFNYVSFDQATTSAMGLGSVRLGYRGPAVNSMPAYEQFGAVQLQPWQYRLSGQQHSEIATAALSDAINASPATEAAYRAAMGNDFVDSLLSGEKPTGYIWHHALRSQAGGQAGWLQLVNEQDHILNGNTIYHPNGYGGYQEWAAPASAPYPR
jgi:RHS repeat-associated protein